MKPIRIQRKRVKGFNLQIESLDRNGLRCIYVGRPTRWGNPFWHAAKFHGLSASLALYSATARGIWDPALVHDWPNDEATYNAHCAFLKRFGMPVSDAISVYLRDHNLACWCKEGDLCHADILLELANIEEHEKTTKAKT